MLDYASFRNIVDQNAEENIMKKKSRGGGDALKQILSASRYLIIIAVICIFLAATTLLIYGTLLTGNIILDLIATAKVSTKGSKDLLLSLIELVDLFLLTTVLYIISVGLYELFIAELNLPPWLIITDLDMLKDKLIGVVIVVLSVLFLGQVISWDGQRDLLGFGVAIALVIATLTYFLNQKPAKKDTQDKKGPDETATQKE
jgi:uncharacterized membrane protein YqhA